MTMLGELVKEEDEIGPAIQEFGVTMFIGLLEADDTSTALARDICELLSAHGGEAARAEKVRLLNLIKLPETEQRDRYFRNGLVSLLETLFGEDWVTDENIVLWLARNSEDGDARERAIKSLAGRDLPDKLETLVYCLTTSKCNCVKKAALSILESDSDSAQSLKDFIYRHEDRDRFFQNDLSSLFDDLFGEEWVTDESVVLWLARNSDNWRERVKAVESLAGRELSNKFETLVDCLNDDETNAVRGTALSVLQSDFSEQAIKDFILKGVMPTK
ncbi:MAG: hypothetical protein V1738_06590 [Patescibacteria group bacterium]